MPFSCSFSLRNSSAALATPKPDAATSGRVASKVAIAPLKPVVVFSTVGLPSRFSNGTRASTREMAAVSLARMPSLCSSLVTFTPGVPASTTKARIPARPAEGSILAHTTMKPLPSFSYSLKALSPAVTKIFSPLMTHSLVFSSNMARARMAEVSEPAPGSVMHIAAKVGLSSLKRARNLAFCSGEPAACTAAAPSPPPGVMR